MGRERRKKPASGADLPKLVNGKEGKAQYLTLSGIRHAFESTISPIMYVLRVAEEYSIRRCLQSVFIDCSVR